MSTLYSIWLQNPLGQTVSLITRFNRLQYTLATNGIGTQRLTLPASFPISYIAEDWRLLVYRQVDGGKKYLDGDAVWLIRDWEENISQQGQQEFTILSYSASEILDRAIIAYSAASSFGSHASAPIDNIIKAMVRENLGATAADPARNISTYLLAEADLTLGPSAPKTAPWRQLLPTLRELAQTADNLGTPVFFDVVAGDPLILRTYITQRGINHSRSSGQPVILSTRNGAVAEIKRSYQSSQERNFIYAGGGATAVWDPARMAISPFNRREFFMDAGNLTAADLSADANATFKDKRPRVTVSAKIRDTAGLRYGREYGYGDRVVIESGSYSADCRIDSVQVSVEGGRETIQAEVRVL